MREKIVINNTLKEVAEEQINKLSKRIEFYVSEYTVEILCLKMDRKDFIVPDYQRNKVWDNNRQSRFIESVIMGLPIPFLFFWERPDGKLEIVDGSQRLRTIQEFINNELSLNGLRTLTKINGFKFSDLVPSRQRKIKNRSIRGILLSEHADATVRYDLFERINTGSKTATAAEVRRGALAGDFMNLIIELAKNNIFKKVAPLATKSLNERGDEDLVTRFFAYSDGLENYKDNPRDFLFDYVKNKNIECERNKKLILEYRTRFLNTMNAVDLLFEAGFKKSKTENTTKNSRFEAIAIGTYLALQENEMILSKKPDTTWAYKSEFLSVCRADGANAKKKLIRRIEYVKCGLLGLPFPEVE